MAKMTEEAKAKRAATRAANEVARKARDEAAAKHKEGNRLADLAYRVAFARQIHNSGTSEVYAAYCRFIEDARAGKLGLTEEGVAQELEAAAAKMRLHPSCKENFLQFGSPAYCRFPGDTFIDEHTCDGCGRSLACDHKTDDVTGDERYKQFMFGTLRCVKCGELFGKHDSSD